MLLTESIISELFEDVLLQENHVIKNNCDNIANTLGYELEERFDIPAYTVKAPVNKKKHFVCVVPGEFIKNKKDTEFVIIDGSLQQFSEDYPYLNIVSISESTVYDHINKPEYTLPETVSESQNRLDSF